MHNHPPSADALETNRTVTILDLSGNLIGGRPELVIASQLGLRGKGLTNVDHDTLNKGTDCAGTAFGHVLRTNQTLTRLDLSWNQLSVVTGIELGNSLALNESLTDMNCAYNSLGDLGAQLIGKVRMRMPPPATPPPPRDRHNCCPGSPTPTPPPAPSARQALASNRGLRRLNLSYNGIGNRGACTLAGSLQVNNHLKYLMLDGNPLGLLGGRALMITYNFAKKTRFIGMTDCKFDIGDFSHDSLDLAASAGDWDLNFDDPIHGAHNWYVAKELLRLATVKNGCSMEGVTVQQGQSLEGIVLKRPLNDKESVEEERRRASLSNVQRRWGVVKQKVRSTATPSTPKLVSQARP